MFERPMNSINSAARRMGACTKTVERLVSNGKLGYVRVGRRVFIPEEELQRYLSANYRPPFNAKEVAKAILKAG